MRGHSCTVTAWSDTAITCQHDAAVTPTTNMMRVVSSGGVAGWYSLTESIPVLEPKSREESEYGKPLVTSLVCKSTGTPACNSSGDVVTVSGYRFTSDTTGLAVTVGVSCDTLDCADGLFSRFPRRGKHLLGKCGEKCALVLTLEGIRRLLTRQQLSTRPVLIPQSLECEVQADSWMSSFSGMESFLCALPAGGSGKTELTVSVYGVLSDPFHFSYASTDPPRIDIMTCDGDCFAPWAVITLQARDTSSFTTNDLLS